MDGERFEKKKDVRRRLKREAFQLRVEAQVAAKTAPTPASANPFAAEMSLNDLARSVPLLDDLAEPQERPARARDGAEDEEPSKRAAKKSKAKKRTKMTAGQICEQWDRVLNNDAFQEAPLEAVQRHIGACFEQGLLK
jgi:hypothetical protein